jgi:hypothetical protein
LAARPTSRPPFELCRARGVTCGEIVDFDPSFGFFVLMLGDPDGIQIELFANYA